MTYRTLLGITYAGDGTKLRHRGPGPSRELCIMACVFCKDAEFWRWMTSIDPKGAMFDEDGAKTFILTACVVASRNELDTDPAAAARFHELVRKPLVDWKEERFKETFYDAQLGQPWGEPS